MVITSPHSSDWLFALPVSACGVRLSDEAIRIAVGLKLGLNLCEPHNFFLSACVKQTLMCMDYTVFPANAAPAGPQDTRSPMTLFSEHS